MMMKYQYYSNSYGKSPLLRQRYGPSMTPNNRVGYSATISGWRPASSSSSTTVVTSTGTAAAAKSKSGGGIGVGLSQLLRSKDMKWAMGGWLFFVAENVILSENRTYLINEFGDDNYHRIYGTLSTIATASIGYSYYRLRNDYKKIVGSNAMKNAAMTMKSPSIIAASWVLLTLGTNLISQTMPKLQLPVAFSSTSTKDDNEKKPSSLVDGSSAATVAPQSSSWSLQVRCLFDFTDKRDEASSSSSSIYGLERVTRHPGLWSFACLSLGYGMLLPIQHPIQLWFTGPTLIAWIGGSHTDSRYRRNMGGSLSPDYDNVTSNIPFAAMITGRQGQFFVPAFYHLITEEIKPLNAIMATTLSTMYVLSYIRKNKRIPPNAATLMSR